MSMDMVTMDMAFTMATTVRGLLRPSPRLMPTMARGKLRLSPLLLPRLHLRLMLTITTDTPLDTDTHTDTMVMDPAMDTFTVDTMDTPMSMVDTMDTITNLLIFVKN